MPRTCFVIMPFSKTESCSTKEWTWIFENVIKKAVEESGLDYECKRSSATRGSIIKAIIQDLDDSYVVIADLTDKNPNVFYELGIRHSIALRTILIAQKRSHIPSDLRGYAGHVYKWKSTRGRSNFAKKIKSLFEEIELNPEKSDNPVRDHKHYTDTIEEPETEVPSKNRDMSLLKSGVKIVDLIQRIVGPGK